MNPLNRIPVVDDHIARIDKALERLAKGRQRVEATIKKQERRLAKNADAIERVRELLSQPIR